MKNQKVLLLAGLGIIGYQLFKANSAQAQEPQIPGGSQTPLIDFSSLLGDAYDLPTTTEGPGYDESGETPQPPVSDDTAPLPASDTPGGDPGIYDLIVENRPITFSERNYLRENLTREDVGKLRGTPYSGGSLNPIKRGTTWANLYDALGAYPLVRAGAIVPAKIVEPGGGADAPAVDRGYVSSYGLTGFSSPEFSQVSAFGKGIGNAALDALTGVSNLSTGDIRGAYTSFKDAISQAVNSISDFFGGFGSGGGGGSEGYGGLSDPADAEAQEQDDLDEMEGIGGVDEDDEGW